jgi:hypothetical protein
VKKHRAEAQLARGILQKQPRTSRDVFLKTANKRKLTPITKHQIVRATADGLMDADKPNQIRVDPRYSREKSGLLRLSAVKLSRSGPERELQLTSPPGC